MGRPRKNQELLDKALNDPIRKKYKLNILFADEKKNPGLRGWDIWVKKPQTEKDIKSLCKTQHTNYGYITGHNGLQAIDFDAYWIYKLVAKQFGERFRTHTVQTPNGGFHSLFIVNDPVTNKGYSDNLKVDILGGFNCIVYGTAKDRMQKLNPYISLYDEAIRTDNTIVKDVEAFLQKTLQKYIFFNYKCIHNHLKGKVHHLEHDQRLHLATFMAKSGAKDEEINDYFRLCSDWNEDITQKQIDITRRKIASGDLSWPTCESLTKAFGWNTQECRGCVRKIKSALEENKPDYKKSKAPEQAEHPEARFTPDQLSEVFENQQKSLTHGMHYDDDIGLIYNTKIDGLSHLYGCSKEHYVVAADDINDVSKDMNAKAFTINGYTSKLSDFTQQGIVKLAKEVYSYGEIEGLSLSELFEDIMDRTKYYLDLSMELEDGELDKDTIYYFFVLWIIGTYYRVIWSWYPYITFFGLRDVGKSTALTLLSKFCFNGSGYVSGFSTEPLLLRKSASTKGIMFVDHYEEIRLNRDKRQIYKEFLENSWRLNSSVEKVNPITLELDVFNIPSSVAIGTRYSDDVLEEKGIQITMLETTRNELRERSRLMDSDPYFDDIQYKAMGTALIEQDRVLAFYNELPKVEGLYGRDWNKFTPILTLALAIDTQNNRKYSLFENMSKFAVSYRKSRKEDVTDYEEVLLKLILEYGIESASFVDLQNLMRKEGYSHYSWRTAQTDIKKLGILNHINRNVSPIVAHFKLDVAKARAKQRSIEWRLLEKEQIQSRLQGGDIEVENLEIVDPDMIMNVSNYILTKIQDELVNTKAIYPEIKEKFNINKNEFQWILSVMKENQKITKVKDYIRKR